ncbi:hypothetical protein [Lyngbya aestuarii]|uniref:hypothetical protein n=1 Tax=Lyngbya aestuarii TaxID=118322 RepID=UPI00403D7BBF
MKFTVVIVGLATLLNGCTNPTNPINEESVQTTQISQTKKCPESPSVLPIKLSENEGWYDRFEYQIKEVVANEETIKFQTPKYDFVFCRDSSSWTVNSGTLASEKSVIEATDPAYETIELDGKSYQYRVVLDPNPLPDFQVEPEKVVFELITPDSEQPQNHTLYTLEEMKQAQAGEQLGLPRITAALSYDNRLFWTVASEQGEGNGGIATIINYDPQSDQVALIQPKEIKGQQITDLVIAGEPKNPTFWMATQLSGEGNPDLPGMGLVAYLPKLAEEQLDPVRSYDIRNSPIIGAIPEKLLLEKDKLWVGTGNGICQVQWQEASSSKSWSCWRFALMAKLPREGMPLHSTLFSETSAATVETTTGPGSVEVLWWSPLNSETGKGRYEVRYNKGFTVALNDQGASVWSGPVDKSSEALPAVDWVGREWHWRGDQFVRGFDAVALNQVGGGPMGIGSNQVDTGGRIDWNTMRGDLEILNLSKDATEIKYHSGWVEDSLLEPYLTVAPQEPLQNYQLNPLKAVANKLKS